MGIAFVICALVLATIGRLPPQSPAPSVRDGRAAARPTLFEHPTRSRYWLSGQINVVTQGHPSFPAAYTGAHSLTPARETETSRVMTLYTGLRVTERLSALFDAEMTGGRGIGQAFGLAGYTNLDVVRNPTLGGTPYTARLMLHYLLPLSSQPTDVSRGPLSLASRAAARRLEVRVGKFSLVDFFDVNAVGSDSHLQFLNWAIDNNAAYDYAADTRGYTVAAIAEYYDGPLVVRFAEALMPKVANGLTLDYDLRRARSENLEVERRVRVAGREAVFKGLVYANHANMGSYREAIDNFSAGLTPQPDVTAHPRQTRLKYGACLNLQADLTSRVRSYARAGWNEGHYESFVYTEANDAASGGLDASGEWWHRPHDRLGMAISSAGLSTDHREYLALGGLGFLLGDGTLRYGRERVFEVYYTGQLWNGLFVAGDLQHLENPGYNRDRGPVFVATARLHVEF